MENFKGAYSEAKGGAWLFSKLGLARTESMDLVNDPRFFSDNVINYRLAAFSGLGVISELLAANAIGYVMDMDKYMDWTTTEGVLQFLAFFLITMVLFMNTLAVYVAIAQRFHTLRLSTSGSLGFEAAASYYLNDNIALWRHMAIKGMLWSLPLFVISQGLRVIVKFRRENQAEIELPEDAPFRASIQGYGFCGLFVVAAFILYLVHRMHYAIFLDRFHSMSIDKGYRQLTQSLAMTSMAGSRPYDPEQ
mmetsp:Transcript_30047/g.70020  ORF Transcript_30047/g.70020 Transcript_30047/m.70020 type:complete len:249 (-) Transcript_30047:87-833(-)